MSYLVDADVGLLAQDDLSVEETALLSRDRICKRGSGAQPPDQARGLLVYPLS